MRIISPSVTNFLSLSAVFLQTVYIPLLFHLPFLLNLCEFPNDIIFFAFHFHHSHRHVIFYFFGLNSIVIQDGTTFHHFTLVNMNFLRNVVLRIDLRLSRVTPKGRQINTFIQHQLERVDGITCCDCLLNWMTKSCTDLSWSFCLIFVNSQLNRHSSSIKWVLLNPLSIYVMSERQKTPMPIELQRTRADR